LIDLFKNWDVILAPATPIPAPRFDDLTTSIGGVDYPLRPLLGRFVQALAPAGLPIAVVPYIAPGALPVGIQIIAAPFREDNALRVAATLESRGFSNRNSAEA
jgi:Asp-tRNA(Asn)/Glu-tRNA(Gln) amidotransferase A subunit family amidase